jgi:hypothetical protein
MSWRAQSRSKDAKTPSPGRTMSEKTEPDLRPIQPYVEIYGNPILAIDSNKLAHPACPGATAPPVGTCGVGWFDKSD